MTFINTAPIFLTATNKLGACKAGMSSQQIQERKQWWNELHQARNAENQCWQPSHSAHVTEAKSLSCCKRLWYIQINKEI